MITRGKFIGDIVDAFALLKNQLNSRAQLGLTDITLFCEDYIKEILNITYNYKLINLNSGRKNEPGIDLGDKFKKLAYQVTITKSSEKIIKTIDKITTEQKKIYSTFFIFIIGSKQKSYSSKRITSAVNKAKISFSNEDHVVDLDDILKDIMFLEQEKLQQLHHLISSKNDTFLTELEIPDENGKYKTSYTDYLEKIPKPSYSNCRALFDFWEGKSGAHVPINKLEEHFFELIEKLKKVPRLTREFYNLIFQKGDWDEYERYRRILFNKLNRILNISEERKHEEIEILKEYSLVYLDGEEDHESGTTKWYVQLYSIGNSEDYIFLTLYDFLLEYDLDSTDLFVHLDFSSLASD